MPDHAPSSIQHENLDDLLAWTLKNFDKNPDEPIPDAPSPAAIELLRFARGESAKFWVWAARANERIMSQAKAKAENHHILSDDAKRVQVLIDAVREDLAPATVHKKRLFCHIKWRKICLTVDGTQDFVLTDDEATELRDWLIEVVPRTISVASVTLRKKRMTQQLRAVHRRLPEETLPDALSVDEVLAAEESPEEPQPADTWAEGIV